jgi:UDP-N-acetylglucosamine 2-epimerase (non-hydrolysing)
VHTGQHYTPTLDEVFFRELDLPAPEVNLRVGSLPAPEQVARIVVGVAEALRAISPRLVLVQGDTNSVLGGALAAHKLGIPIAHLEAGLRSDDWSMPEEGNRVLAGRVAAMHLCPTAAQAARLAREGITRGVYVVGNTVVDASLQFGKRARERSTILRKLELDVTPFALLTLHRPSNVDEPGRLRRLLEGLAETARLRGIQLVFPIHPRTLHKARDAGLQGLLDAGPFRTVDPLGYLDLLALVQRSEVVLTDSGGLQEEACTLHVPCVTLRPNTERPETVEVGANLLCDSDDATELARTVAVSCCRARDWVNPFGDGHASQRVVDLMLDRSINLSPSGQP